MKSDDRKECRTDNRRLAQWRVKWLIEHSTSHQLLWCIDSLVLPCLPAGREIRHCAKQQNVISHFKATETTVRPKYFVNLERI